jgi:large subunit ribosomal protein L2
MGLRNFKPTTPSRRFMVLADKSEIDKRKKPEKSLTVGIKRTSGRNHHGRITVRFRAGGHKRRYRIIDFKRDKFDVKAEVISIEYDPNRSANIALLQYEDGEKRYILAPKGLKKGDIVVSSESVEIKPGNATQLKNIPLGTLVHNVEFLPGGGGKIARGAGNSVQIMANENGYTLLKMPSGELRKVRETCMATIGVVGNEDHSNEKHGKAGRRRWLGRKPHVRGMVMNPVDHPMGGGEAKSKGHLPQSPWGVPAKGYKTRRGKKPSDVFIVRKRK